MIIQLPACGRLLIITGHFTNWFRSYLHLLRELSIFTLQAWFNWGWITVDSWLGLIGTSIDYRLLFYLTDLQTVQLMLDHLIKVVHHHGFVRLWISVTDIAYWLLIGCDRVILSAISAAAYLKFVSRKIRPILALLLGLRPFRDGMDRRFRVHEPSWCQRRYLRLLWT